MNNLTEIAIKEYIASNKLAFNSTHNKLSLCIINRIYKKMKNGIKFEAIKINGNSIIDGHHRYISSKLAEIDVVFIDYPKTSATIECAWKDVQFLNEEWDTLVKIQYLNEIDAKYNNIPLEKLMEITK
jgi:hypothetical protein